MSLLVADWLTLLDEEQKARSAALLHAGCGSDWRVAERAAERCNQWDVVRKYAVLLDDALRRAGWTEARPTFGRLDEGETRTEA